MEPEYHPHWVRRQHTGHRAHPKESLPTQSKKDLLNCLSCVHLKIFSVCFIIHVFTSEFFLITSGGKKCRKET